MLVKAVPLALVAALAATSAAQSRRKQVRDQGEHELYNQTLLDASNPAKQILDLDLWTEKYPDSDFKDDRLYLYLQAYGKMDPPHAAQVLDYGSRLMARGLETVFNGKGGGMNIVNVLFLVAWHAAAMPDATAAQLSLGSRAARQLLEFAPKHFVAANRPADLNEEQWSAARADIEARARKALAAIAMAPGNQAMGKQPADCSAAEAAYRSAHTEYPGDPHISYAFAKALTCLAQADPERGPELYPQSIFQFVRAAALDPSMGIQDYAAKAYAAYHGNGEGLDRLRQQALASPFPPEGFTIDIPTKTASRQEEKIAVDNPQIALWTDIRTHLRTDDAFQYFNGQLKNTNLDDSGGARALRGTVVEGRPACHSKELLVAMGNAGVGNVRPEITIRLESSLSGKPERGEIEFDGVVKLFTKEPLMLTLDSAAKRITGLKILPCK